MSFAYHLLYLVLFSNIILSSLNIEMKKTFHNKIYIFILISLLDMIYESILSLKKEDKSPTSIINQSMKMGIYGILAYSFYIDLIIYNQNTAYDFIVKNNIILLSITVSLLTIIFKNILDM
jgi:hypothetical protein